MRLWLFMLHLLLISISSIHEAQGIRLKKGSLSNGKLHHNRHIHVSFMNGKIRKLFMASTTSSTTITTKNDQKNGENKGHPKLEGSSSNKKSENREDDISVNPSSLGEPVPEDILDIAEMDYSQARRKSPIHN